MSDFPIAPGPVNCFGPDGMPCGSCPVTIQPILNEVITPVGVEKRTRQTIARESFAFRTSVPYLKNPHTQARRHQRISRAVFQLSLQPNIDR
jgi:hypothetical protein